MMFVWGCWSRFVVELSVRVLAIESMFLMFNIEALLPIHVEHQMQLDYKELHSTVPTAS